MENILFIAYEFPPQNFGGVHRSLAFVKYLKQYNINPVVITLSKKSYRSVYENFSMDEELGKDVLSSSDIIEIESKNINPANQSRLRNFFDMHFNLLGKEEAGWEKDFKKKLPEVVERYKPVAIVVSVPPFGILKLAAWLSKLYSLPLISDFRDAWSQWRTIPYASYLHYLATLLTERKYLKLSDIVIATSNQTLSDFRRLHPKINENKFHLITNGFDDEITEWKIDLQKKDNYVIGYVGSFYYDKTATEMMLLPWWEKKWYKKFQYIKQTQNWLYRSPFFFFKSLRVLFDKYPEYEKILHIKFAGKNPAWLNEMITDFGLNKNVKLLGMLSHKDSINFQQESDALLITSSKVIGGNDYSIAGKTFEYFKMQKPIIAFVCEGAQKEILEKSGTALICNPDDTDASAQNLRGLFQHDFTFKPDNNFLTQLSRKNLTQKLATIINEVTQSGKPS